VTRRVSEREGAALPRSPKLKHPMNVVEFNNVSKSYTTGKVEVPVLNQLTFAIEAGKFVVLMGPSGSGKSTLLNLVGGLDHPSEGTISVCGENIGRLGDNALTAFRGAHIGFIFQSFNLIPVLTAAENVEYPLLNTDLPAERRRRRVARLLAAVGLEDRADHLPGELSGGQRQRVAIARALARKPKLVIADEPTANLDSRTTASILDLMRHIQRNHGISFLLASHDPRVMREADRTIHLLDGRIRQTVQPRQTRPAQAPAGAAA